MCYSEVFYNKVKLYNILVDPSSESLFFSRSNFEEN